MTKRKNPYKVLGKYLSRPSATKFVRMINRMRAQGKTASVILRVVEKHLLKEMKKSFKEIEKITNTVPIATHSK